MLLCGSELLRLKVPVGRVHAEGAQLGGRGGALQEYNIRLEEIQLSYGKKYNLHTGTNTNIIPKEYYWSYRKKFKSHTKTKTILILEQMQSLYRKYSVV